MARDGLLIGEVAEKAGITRKALRLYESRGILPRAKRTTSGYRVYPSDVLALLRFVAGARRLGLTLSEIAHVVALRRAGGAPCAHVRALLEQKKSDLTEILAEVQRILRAWRSAGNGTAAVCPHIEKGGEVVWKSKLSRSARCAPTAPRSSSRATRSASAKTRTRQS